MVGGGRTTCGIRGVDVTTASCPAVNKVTPGIARNKWGLLFAHPQWAHPAPPSTCPDT